MKIRSITPQKGLFAGEGPIRFSPGINILRGANGIGKTIILEYASLLGHAAVMDFKKPLGDASLIMEVSLSMTDRRFLNEIVSLSTHDPALARFDKALTTIGYSLEELKALAGTGLPPGCIELQFSYPELDDDDLKEMLADEEKIRKKIQIFGKIESHVRLVQALNIWSRPILTSKNDDNDVWSVTPRFLRAAGHSKVSDQPAPVFYINTDMYEFGTGLDIRESPKHLREKMTSVLVDRLQLVPCENVTDDCLNLSEMLKDTENQSLFCHEAFKDAWVGVFGTGHPFKLGRVQCSLSPSRESEIPSRKVEWTIRIGTDESSGFVSSGENQALFLLAVLYGLVSEGSCMLLDEPELHLTFGAGSLLMEKILERTEGTRSQAIIVTHLPHLYRSRVENRPDAWKTEDDYKYRTIRMIFIDRDCSTGSRIQYDVDAMNLAARSSHADVMKLVEGLLLKEDIPILPRRGEFLSWLTLSGGGGKDD